MFYFHCKIFYIMKLWDVCVSVCVYIQCVYMHLHCIYYCTSEQNAQKRILLSETFVNCSGLPSIMSILALMRRVTNNVNMKDWKTAMQFVWNKDYKDKYHVHNFYWHFWEWVGLCGICIIFLQTLLWISKSTQRSMHEYLQLPVLTSWTVGETYQPMLN